MGSVLICQPIAPPKFSTGKNSVLSKCFEHGGLYGRCLNLVCTGAAWLSRLVGKKGYRFPSGYVQTGNSSSIAKILSTLILLGLAIFLWRATFDPPAEATTQRRADWGIDWIASKIPYVSVSGYPPLSENVEEDVSIP